MAGSVFRQAQSIGFTLIDTMITIVIIAVLAAMVIPKFIDMSSKAGETSLESQLRTVRKQIELHDFERPTTPFDPLVPGGPATWTQLTAKGYLKTPPENALQSDQVNVAAAPADGVAWVWADLGTGHNLYGVDEAGGWYDADGDGVPD